MQEREKCDNLVLIHYDFTRRKKVEGRDGGGAAR